MVYTVEHGILPTPTQRIGHALAKLKLVYLLPVGVSGMAIFWIVLLLTIVAVHPPQTVKVPLPIVYTVPASSDTTPVVTKPATPTIPVTVATPSTQPIAVGVANPTE